MLDTIAIAGCYAGPCDAITEASSFDETLLYRPFLARAVAATFSIGLHAHAQEKYKSDFRLSTVPGSAFPWGKSDDRWAELVKKLNPFSLPFLTPDNP